MSLGWEVFADSLIEDGRRERFGDGIKAFVQLYMEEYQDATALEPSVLSALETLNCLSNTDVLDDLPGLIAEALGEMTAVSGRQFDPVPGLQE